MNVLIFELFFEGKYKPRSMLTVQRPKPKSKYLLKENQCFANVSANVTDKEPQEVLNLSKKSGSYDVLVHKNNLQCNI